MAKTIQQSSGEKGDDEGNSGDRKESDQEIPDAAPDLAKTTGAEAEPVPVPGPDSMEDISEEAEEARHLYMDFMRTEIHRRGISEPPFFNSEDNNNNGSTDNFLNWTRAGRELRQLADVFARSRERESVRKRAGEVCMEALNAEHFFLLLQELFQGEGVTRERILVLFFFCADLAIESLRRGFHQSFHTFMEWSLKYIMTRVARWVHDHGGWGQVLRSSLEIAFHVTSCCAFIAVIVACAVYIRRSPK